MELSVMSERNSLPRSIEPNLQEVVVDSFDQNESKPQFVAVRVLSPGRSTLNLRVSPGITVNELALMIRSSYKLPHDTRVRLLSSGRELREESLLEEIAVDSSLSVHCAVVMSPSPLTSSAQSDFNSRARTDRRQQIRMEDFEESIGFDRLRYMGFSDEEISLARHQFRNSLMTRMHASRSRQPRVPFTENELRALEERFMSGEDAPAVATSNLSVTSATPAVAASTERIESVPEGTHFDLVFGLVIGFLLGFLVLYWIWERTEKHLSRRRIVGFLIGLFSNIAIATIHVFRG